MVHALLHVEMVVFNLFVVYECDLELVEMLKKCINHDFIFFDLDSTSTGFLNPSRQYHYLYNCEKPILQSLWSRRRGRTTTLGTPPPCGL